MHSGAEQWEKWRLVRFSHALVTWRLNLVERQSRLLLTVALKESLELKCLQKAFKRVLKGNSFRSMHSTLNAGPSLAFNLLSSEHFQTVFLLLLDSFQTAQPLFRSASKNEKSLKNSSFFFKCCLCPAKTCKHKQKPVRMILSGPAVWVRGVASLVHGSRNAIQCHQLFSRCSWTSEAPSCCLS